MCVILRNDVQLGTQEGNDQEDHGMGEPCKFVETVRGVAERNMAAVVAAQAAGKAGDDGAQEAGVQAGLAHLGVLHNAAQRYAAEQQQVRPPATEQHAILRFFLLRVSWRFAALDSWACFAHPLPPTCLTLYLLAFTDL